MDYMLDNDNASNVTRTRSAGRPRSETVRRQILATTIRMLETETVQSISIEAIARAAAVSKATIYRWWDSKAAIVLDAFIEHHLIHTPMRRDIPPGQAIAQHLRALTEQYSGWGGRIVAQIVAEGHSNPAILRAFRERFHYGRRAVVREIMEEWRKTGEIDPSTNIELLMDVLYAPIYMRLLIGHAPLTDSFAQDLWSFVETLLGAAVSSGPDSPLIHLTERKTAVSDRAGETVMSETRPKGTRTPRRA